MRNIQLSGSHVGSCHKAHVVQTQLCRWRGGKINDAQVERQMSLSFFFLALRSPIDELSWSKWEAREPEWRVSADVLFHVVQLVTFSMFGFHKDPVLSDAQLVRLGQHKYSSSGTTLLDPLMQRFWNWFVNKVPLSIAPNVLTVTGLLVNAVTTLILILFSPDARHDVSDRAVFLYSASWPDDIESNIRLQITILMLSIVFLSLSFFRFHHGHCSYSRSVSLFIRLLMPSMESKLEEPVPRLPSASYLTTDVTHCLRCLSHWPRS